MSNVMTICIFKKGSAVNKGMFYYLGTPAGELLAVLTLAGQFAVVTLLAVLMPLLLNEELFFNSRLVATTWLFFLVAVPIYYGVQSCYRLLRWMRMRLTKRFEAC